MYRFLKLPKQLFFLITIATVFNCISPASANEVLAYKNYQYSCGNYTIENNVINARCQSISQQLGHVPRIEQPEFIFQSKANILQYHKALSYDTGIADYLVSSVFSIYFPTLEDSRPHSGGSFFGGIKLQENIRLDAEIVGIFKGNSLEKNYFDLASFLSLRFSFPLSAKPGYPLLYLSPGVGISELDTRYTGLDDEDTHPTWQVETGVALPIQSNVGGYGGIKYVNQLTKEGNSFFGTELGVTLRL